MFEYIFKQQDEIATLIDCHVVGDGVHKIPFFIFLVSLGYGRTSFGVYELSLSLWFKGRRRNGLMKRGNSQSCT
ncbi:hypothetical protein QF028_002319 [Neobacillus sp. B4I6]|jgi:hypothetical protein